MSFLLMHENEVDEIDWQVKKEEADFKYVHALIFLINSFLIRYLMIYKKGGYDIMIDSCDWQLCSHQASRVTSTVSDTKMLMCIFICDSRPAVAATGFVWWVLRAVIPLPDSGYKWHHTNTWTAPKKTWYFEFTFAAGSEDPSSIFVYSLWQVIAANQVTLLLHLISHFFPFFSLFHCSE